MKILIILLISFLTSPAFAGRISNIKPLRISIKNKINVINTFSSTGTYTFVVPSGITSVDVEVVGAGGGNSSSKLGGLGAKVTETLAVTPFESLSIIVGGKPELTLGYDSVLYASSGGYNSGGRAGVVTQSGKVRYLAGAGGGFSGIKRGASFLTIAGAGAGAAVDGNGGDGGQVGTDGVGDEAGKGATQSAVGLQGGVGAPGVGNNGGTGADGLDYYSNGGGGAGGYYGGGGGGRGISGTGSAGGGGSSNGTGTNTVYTDAFNPSNTDGYVKISYYIWP